MEYSTKAPSSSYTLSSMDQPATNPLRHAATQVAATQTNARSARRANVFASVVINVMRRNSAALRTTALASQWYSPLGCRPSG